MNRIYKFILPTASIILLITLELLRAIELNVADYINISLVILTYFYVSLTWEMVKNIKDESHLEKRPYIIFDISTNNSLLYFHIENIGKTLAKDVSVKISPDISITKNYTLNTSIFDNPIPYFPPNKIVKTFIGSRANFFEENPIIFEVTITYSDSFKNKFNESYSLNLTHIKNELYPLKKDITDLVKITEKLVIAVQNIP